VEQPACEDGGGEVVAHFVALDQLGHEVGQQRDDLVVHEVFDGAIEARDRVGERLDRAARPVVGVLATLYSYELGQVCERDGLEVAERLQPLQIGGAALAPPKAAARSSGMTRSSTAARSPPRHKASPPTMWRLGQTTPAGHAGRATAHPGSTPTLNIIPLWLCSAMWQCAIHRPASTTTLDHVG
jgi:hypothetical protein